jgi:hypothetical protein
MARKLTNKILIGIGLAVAIIFLASASFAWYYGTDNLDIALQNQLESIGVKNAEDNAVKEDIAEPVANVKVENMPAVNEAATPTPSPSSPPVTPPSTTLKASVLINVPFTSQAPYGDWSDPLQQDGCEEASLIMVKHWITGEWLNKAIALEEILAASKWEDEHMGGALSLSTSDAAILAKEYFNISNVAVVKNPYIDDIRRALSSGKVVIVPANGQTLNNPHFTPPGPAEHMLVIVGYDDKTKEFITNDPGTRLGQGYRYSYEVLYAAIRDYPTGHRERVIIETKSMIVIGK